jgi:hypothetical protein
MLKLLQMRIFAPPTSLVLISGFDPKECANRLREAIDVERPTGFGFSGYRGSKPFVGEVNGNQFRVLQRTYSFRNSFPPVLTGEVQPQGVGTRINGVFDLEPTSKVAIGLFGALGLLFIVLIIYLVGADKPVLLTLFVCGYGALLFFMPRIIRGAGGEQERSIAQFLRTTLEAEAERKDYEETIDS